MRFTVDYHARLRQGQGLYFFKDDGRPHRPQQVYSGGGTDGNPRWLPTWGGPADKATWELAATVPANLRVVSNGRLVSDRPAPGGLHTVTWRQEKPASTYLISFAAAPFAKLTERWRGIPVEYYVYRSDSALARAAVRRHPRHDGDLQPAHRGAVPVAQVRPGHRGGLHWRHGERERDDAGGLAP